MAVVAVKAEAGVIRTLEGKDLMLDEAVSNGVEGAMAHYHRQDLT